MSIKIYCEKCRAGLDELDIVCRDCYEALIDEIYRLKEKIEELEIDVRTK